MIRLFHQSPSIRAATSKEALDSPDTPKKEKNILKRWEKVQKLLDDAATSPSSVSQDTDGDMSDVCHLASSQQYLFA